MLARIDPVTKNLLAVLAQPAGALFCEFTVESDGFSI